MIPLLALDIRSLAAHIEDHIHEPSSSRKTPEDPKSNIVTEQDLGWKSTISQRHREKEDSSEKEKSVIFDPFTEESEKQLKTIINRKKNQKDTKEEFLTNQTKNLEEETQKINNQLNELNQKTHDISNYQDNRKKKSEQEVTRLAHVYEQMPPRDAAAIFNVLDIRVLVPVAQHMSPRKISSVIGGMLPDRANILTQYLIGTRKLSPNYSVSSVNP